MMNCDEATYVMPLYESSELEPTAMAAFELHLRRCSACAREVEHSRMIDGLLRDAFDNQPADAAAVRARLRKQISVPKRRLQLPFSHLLQFKTVAAAMLVALVLGAIYIALQSTSESVYASAVDDHTEEVVQKVPAPGWRETPSDIEQMVSGQLGDANIIERLQSPDYYLTRGRICELVDQKYIHLVYKNREREISVYIRVKDRELPGAVVQTVKGCGLHAQATGGLQVAGFQSEKVRVLFVSDLPREENLRIAREAAERLA